jgi:hypothetical protein
MPGPLFKVETQNVSNNTGASVFFPHSAPKLSPYSDNGLIDIKNQFVWTLQRTLYSRSDVPTLYMREQMVEVSSALQNFRYSIGNTAPLVLGTSGAAAGAAIGATFLKSLVGAVAGGVGGAAAGAAAGILGRDLIQGGVRFDKEYLKSYSGLYATKETGFKYNFPVIKEDGVILEQLNTDWSGEAKLKGVDKYTEGGYASSRTTTNKIAGLLNNIGDGQSKIATLLGNIFPAAYTEKPRSYNYGNESLYNIEIKLHLFNTVDWESTKRNFELVTLLYYQNLPNRLNPILLDPPVIYEAYIPGVFYSPFCFINKLQITGSGANRELLMPIPVNDTTIQNEKPRYLGGARPDGFTNLRLTSIIPDVYTISFTLVSLVPQTQNLKFQALMSGTNNDGFAVSPTPPNPAKKNEVLGVTGDTIGTPPIVPTTQPNLERLNFPGGGSLTRPPGF